MNQFLKNLFDADQADRKYTSINWEVVDDNDAGRRMGVCRQISEDKLDGADDYYHAAMIFHHGNRIEHIAFAKLLIENSLYIYSLQDCTVHNNKYRVLSDLINKRLNEVLDKWK